MTVKAKTLKAGVDEASLRETACRKGISPIVCLSEIYSLKGPTEESKTRGKVQGQLIWQERPGVGSGVIFLV